MTKVAQAQAIEVLWVVGNEEPVPQATPTQITAILGLDGVAAIQAMGLSRSAAETLV